MQPFCLVPGSGSGSSSSSSLGLGLGSGWCVGDEACLVSHDRKNNLRGLCACVYARICAYKCVLPGLRTMSWTHGHELQ